MLGIVNIDENPRQSGRHEYSLRLNNLEICKFHHKREECMSRILDRAADAVRAVERRGDPVQMAKERFVAEELMRVTKMIGRINDLRT